MTLVKFGDVITINPKEKLPKGTTAPKVAMEGIQPFTKYISSYVFEEYAGGAKFRNGDTLLARITPSLENGKTSIVSELPTDSVGFGSTEFLVFRATDQILPDYLYYLTTTPNFRDMAIKSMTGTSGRQRVQTDVVSDYEFNLPSIEQQKSVVDKLVPLDAKIRLNNQINDNLLELAQTIFDKTVQEDAEYVALQDLVAVKDGTHDSPKQQTIGHPLVTSKAIKGTSVDFSQTKLISEDDFQAINKRSKVDYGDILISMIGTVGLTQLVIDKEVDYAIKNVGLIKTSTSPKLKLLIYLAIKSDSGRNYIAQSLAGSTQQFLSLTNLRKFPIPRLSEIELSHLGESVSALFDAVELNADELKNLIEIRNALIKKLLS